MKVIKSTKYAEHSVSEWECNRCGRIFGRGKIGPGNTCPNVNCQSRDIHEIDYDEPDETSGTPWIMIDPNRLGNA